MRGDRCRLLFCDLARRGNKYRDPISHLSLCPAPYAPCFLDGQDVVRGSDERFRCTCRCQAGTLPEIQLHPFYGFKRFQKADRTIEGRQTGEIGIQPPNRLDRPYDPVPMPFLWVLATYVRL